MPKIDSELLEKKPEFIPQVQLGQIFLYFFCIITIWVAPISISVFLIIGYMKILILPDLHIYANPLEVIRQLTEGNPQFFILSVISPIAFILIYLLQLFLVALLTKIFISLINQISPTKEMIANKGLDEEERKQIDIYHLRGALYRIMKWIYARCPFPWMIKWAFQFAGNNKFGKGTVLEDQYYCHEYMETGENVYLDKLSIVSTHLVEGAYGALTLKKIYIGDNSVIGANVGVTPGMYMEHDSEIVMNSLIPKFKKLKKERKYFGIPAKRITKEQYEYLMKVKIDSESSEHTKDSFNSLEHLNSHQNIQEISD